MAYSVAPLFADYVFKSTLFFLKKELGTVHTHGVKETVHEIHEECVD